MQHKIIKPIGDFGLLFYFFVLLLVSPSQLMVAWGEPQATIN